MKAREFAWPRSAADLEEQVIKLVDQIEPLLAGKNPFVIQAALAHLMGTLCAGIGPQTRDRFLNVAIEAVRNMASIMVEDMIRSGQAPESWRGGEPEKKH